MRHAAGGSGLFKSPENDLIVVPWPAQSRSRAAHHGCRLERSRGVQPTPHDSALYATHLGLLRPTGLCNCRLLPLTHSQCVGCTGRLHSTTAETPPAPYQVCLSPSKLDETKLETLLEWVAIVATCGATLPAELQPPLASFIIIRLLQLAQ